MVSPTDGTGWTRSGLSPRSAPSFTSLYGFARRFLGYDYDMLMEFGWKGLLPIALGNLLCVAISMTFGYPAGLITWIVLFGGAVAIVMSLKGGKAFATNTRPCGQRAPHRGSQIV